MNQEPRLPEAEEPQMPSPETEEKQTKPSPLLRLASSLFDVVEMFSLAVLVVILIFTFALRLCRVDGSSMENTLHEGENLLISDLFYTPRQNDVVVFHLTEPTSPKNLQKTLVKRVIATEGQTVRIDFGTGEIYIDGVLYDDPYRCLKTASGRPTDAYLNTADADYRFTDNPHFDAEANVLTATVPEGHVFVMGDNRNWSRDSRDSDIGFVDTRCILGRVLLRLDPFTVFSAE